MSFFEDYLNKNININEEIKNIWHLFKQYPNSQGLTLYDCVNQNFLNWELRNGCIKLTRFLELSGINATIKKSKSTQSVSIDEYMHLIEILVSWFDCFTFKSGNMELVIHIMTNINRVLDKLNFEIIRIKLNNMKFPKCVSKDIKVLKSAEIVKDENLAEKIYMYNHKENKGKIYEKAIILSRLYMYFEGIRKVLSNNNYGTMCQLIGELSDKLKVRHKPNNIEEIVINELSNTELEKIYDKLFNAYLTSIITHHFICEDKKDLESIKELIENTRNT